MADATPDLPPSQPNTPSPAETAEAALKTVFDQRRADELKKVEASEIVDPDAKPQRYNQRPATPDDEPAKPKLVDGASTSEPPRDKLLDRALAVDIPLEDAEAMSATTLRKLVAKLERRSEPATQQQTQQAVQQAQEEEEFTLPPLESGDPEIEVLPGLKDGIAKRDEVMLAQQRKIAELEKAHQEREYQERVREARAAERTFGKFIKDTTELHDELGSEVGYPDDPAQMKARGELWQYYHVALNRGKEPDEAFKIATRAVYGDKLAEVESKKLSDRAEAQAKRFSRPPAGGRSKELPLGRERAIQELKELRNGK